jgi:hypothetical protein
MGDRGSVNVESRPQAPDAEHDDSLRELREWQTRLARAYLSGNGAEVERLLALIAEANYTLPPKTSRAA